MSFWSIKLSNKKSYLRYHSVKIGGGLRFTVFFTILISDFSSGLIVIIIGSSWHQFSYGVNCNLLQLTVHKKWFEYNFYTETSKLSFIMPTLQHLINVGVSLFIFKQNSNQRVLFHTICFLILGNQQRKLRKKFFW